MAVANEVAGYSQGEVGAHVPNMGCSLLVSLFIESRHLYLFVSFCHHFQSGLPSGKLT